MIKKFGAVPTPRGARISDSRQSHNLYEYCPIYLILPLLDKKDVP